MAGIIALAGGAKSPWQDVQQLYISNLNSMSAFAVAEQLGLALGIPEILDITFLLWHKNQVIICYCRKLRWRCAQCPSCTKKLSNAEFAVLRSK
jgi:hypothetical protein